MIIILTYNTPADLARQTGYNRTTIVEWIKKGKVKGHKSKKSKNWRIRLSEFSRVKPKCAKHGKTWSKIEIYILENNTHLNVNTLAKMLGRTPKAVACKKCRLKKG